MACGVLTHGGKLRVILIYDNMLPDIACQIQAGKAGAQLKGER
jgi:hypothetical protein